MNQVAVVLPSDEPFSPVYGGALARWVYEVYKRHNREATIFASPSTNTYQGLNLIQVSSFKKLRILNKVWRKLGHHVTYNLYPLLVGLHCLRVKASVIHVMNRPSYVLVLRKILPKAKILLHLQNSHMSTLSDHHLEKVMLQSDIVIGCSNFITNQINEVTNFNYQLKLVTIYNGANVDDLSFSNIYSNTNKIIVYIGRLVPEKGVLELVKAFKIVHKKTNNAKLIIIGSSGFGTYGETSYMQKLKQEAYKIGNAVDFTGYLTHAEIMPYLPNASVFVCPSLWDEPFGMVITEAMAAKVPVIASDRGGIKEVVAESGILINPTNLNDMADAILTLLNDPLYAKEMGQKGFERVVTHFTWDKISADFHKLITK